MEHNSCGTQSAAGRETVFSQRSSHAPCETQKQLKMSSALTDLWPGGPLGYDENVYDFILKGIKTKNFGVEIVTSAFVEDLKKLLHKRKNQHEKTPNSLLSREQLCHILGYLVCEMKPEDVSTNFQKALFVEFTRKTKGNQDIGKCVVQLIRKKCLVTQGDSEDGKLGIGEMTGVEDNPTGTKFLQIYIYFYISHGLPHYN